MKAKDLAEKLLKHPDFDVEFSIMEPDGSDYGVGLRTFEIGVDDIGYSSQRIILGAVKEDLSLRASSAERDAEIERLRGMNSEKDARIAELVIGLVDADYLEFQIAADLEAALIDGGISPDNYVTKNRDHLRMLIDNALLSTPTGAKEKKAHKESGHKWYCDYAADDEAHCLICRKTSSEINGQPCQGAPDGAKERIEKAVWEEAAEIMEKEGNESASARMGALGEFCFEIAGDFRKRAEGET